MARTFASIGRLPEPRDLVVKYLDAQGLEHGPYQLSIDPRREMVRWTRDVMDTTTWLSFRENPAGRLLVYLHRVAIEGRRLVVKYFNEGPDARRPLPPIQRLAGAGLPSPIRSTARLAVGATHSIRVPLRQAGMVSIISRVTRAEAPRQEVDPETGQPLPPAPVFHTVRLVRTLGGSIQVVATARARGPSRPSFLT